MSNCKRNQWIKKFLSYVIIFSAASFLLGCGSTTSVPNFADTATTQDSATANISDTSSGVDMESITDTASTDSANQTADIPSDAGSVVSKTPIHEGIYHDQRIFTDSSFKTDQTIHFQNVEIFNVTPTSFEFEIYESNNKNMDRNLIFKRHTAVYTGDGTTAVFYGNQYTLKFTLTPDEATPPAVTQITVTGFDPVEGRTFLNGTINGHPISSIS